MKKFIFWGVSILLIAFSVVIITTNDLNFGINTYEAELNREEVRKVEQSSQIVTEISSIELPDFSTFFSSEATTLYQPLSSNPKLNFNNISVAFDIENEAKEKIKTGESTEDFKIKSIIRGTCYLGETAMLIEYDDSFIEIEVEGIRIVSNASFKVYIDAEEVYLYYNYCEIEGYEYSSLPNKFLNRWIDLDDGKYSSEVADMTQESLQICSDAIFAEFGYYSDYFNNNFNNKFCKVNGLYILKREHNSEFIFGLIKQNQSYLFNTEEFEDFADMEYEYTKMEGNVAVEIKDDGVQLIFFSDIAADVPKLDVEGQSFSVKADGTTNVVYDIFNINTTTVEKPTNISGW